MTHLLTLQLGKSRYRVALNVNFVVRQDVGHDTAGGGEAYGLKSVEVL